MSRRIVFMALSLVMIFASPLAAYANALVAVAASMAPVMEKMATQYTEKTGVKIDISAGASGTLAKQIEQGAPFQLFLSANEKWARYLEKLSLLSEVHAFASSPLVLWCAKDTPPDITILKEPSAKIAIADPAVAPVGETAKTWLEKEGLFATLEKNGRIIIAGDILKVVLAVQNNGADVGFIPLGTALAAKGSFVRVPAEPQVYFGGIVTKNTSQEASDFWKSLRSPEAVSAWSAAGFDPIAE